MTTEIVLGRQSDGTFVIRESRAAELWRRAAVLNRRATRTGCPEIVTTVVWRGLTVAHPGSQRVFYPAGPEASHVVALIRVRLDGDAPVLAGYSFLARVEHTEAGNLVSRAPRCTAAVPEWARDCDPKCMHCNTSRRRNDTFLVSGPDGLVKQVGRTCLADFTRSADVETALKFWSLLGALGDLFGASAEESEGYGSGSGEVSTLHFLTHVATCVRVQGWRSKKAAEEYGGTPTATDACFAMGKRPEGRTAELWDQLRPTNEDTETAAATMEWAAGLGDRDGLSDYESNLRVACALGYVRDRNTGIVASAIAAYARELGDLARKAKRAAQGPGAHVGVVGKRVVWTLTVVHTIVMDGQWGTTTFVILEDAAGNALTWKASGFKSWKAGDTVTGKATVKEHAVYKGRNQTVLTRAAFELCDKIARAEMAQ